MKYKNSLIILIAITVGAFGGYKYATYTLPSPTDVQVISFSSGYSSLRNITEKDKSEATILMYALMNNSIKEMYKIYPNASPHEKEMIYISFKGYADYILNNPLYNQIEDGIDDLVKLLINKHNKSSNLTGANDAPSS